MTNEISKDEVKKAISMWVDEMPDTLTDVGLADMDEKNKKTLLSAIGTYLYLAYVDGYARGYDNGYDCGYEEGEDNGAEGGYERGYVRGREEVTS